MQGLPVASLVRTRSQHSPTDAAPPTSMAAYLPQRMASAAICACVCQEVMTTTASMSSRRFSSR
jgi:hypothetical protein